MTWHYQIRRETIRGQHVFEIVETYSGPRMYTEHGVRPISESRRGLIRVLEMMLHDAKKYRTLVMCG